MTVTESRPSLGPKHTPGSEKQRNEALDLGIKLTIDGEEFQARIGDVTPALARELRKATGMSFMRLIDACGSDPDVDVISSLVWVARRIRGEDIEHDDVSVGYGSILNDDFDVEYAQPETVEADLTHPEA